MAGIRVLPEILSNKIAAGEVVERPASVVKELVENALDARSSRVDIAVENGGKSLIQVSDNGEGMGRDDAMLSIERYATGKIFTDDDLFSIQTLGFRGEALPSIASVSRFRLETRDEASETGTVLFMEGGRLKKVSEAGLPKGTRVSVRNLFYNTPARKKFLKTPQTEMGRVADTVAVISMARPQVRLTLSHNGRAVKNWPPVRDPADRIIDVLGADLSGRLIRAESETPGDMSVSGWISTPDSARSAGTRIFMYINGRPARDPVMRKALLKGYEGRLMKGRFPVSVLFLTLPFDQVDVNVHPAKQEVKFADPRAVYETVAGAVSLALKGLDAPFARRRPPLPPLPKPLRGGAPSPAGVFETLSDYAGRTPSVSPGRPSPARRPSSPESRAAPRPQAEIKFREKPVTTPEETKREKPESRPPKKEEQAPLWEKKRFSDMRIIGRLKNAYILCESPEGLAIIDPHAAHERVIFEKLKKSMAENRPDVQNLLIPETIETGYREAGLLKEMIPDLAAMGFEVEPFGGNTFAVKSVPAMAVNRDIKRLIADMIEKMAEIGFAPGVEKALDECMAVIACHSAVRSGRRLPMEEMKNLLKEMDECDHPSHCPHGRPSWIQWPVKTIEKSFKRIL
ncbi:DNA mismatch repair protein MutL [Candidatus Desulfarcum epimagneticum]|uniref:DNA mismatch repair protein MutL n=1 Tax=uncultured Desulfobacteraceae bacterium TaxID=218296 RepID=A0A484HLA6_9BACT|nr:DNA mismatch repair protein MutL [uncultured Desulfobacteraceae bacterium]